ncbi:MAG: alpha/beta fold hydrolase [Candidatus Competibacterales bacterium]|nr:alpha/beta fold hydrolase [Candidatus Competibacterales bacterium]
MTELHYDEAGSGEPLLLLHSGGMTRAEWQSQRVPLAEHFQVLLPDLPGHGHSPLSSDRLTVGDCGRAVLALLDHLALEQVHLVGSSLGGATALWLALNHPERIAKLVLYRVNYRKTDTGHAGTRELADPDYWQRMGLSGWMSRIHRPQGGPDAWQRVIARVAEALDPADTDHAHSLEELAGFDRPTLVVAGDRDPLAPLDDLVAMVRALPQAGLWIMPYTTHVTAANTWRSEAFALELIRFLQGRGVVRS